jgi:hypothetical protein
VPPGGKITSGMQELAGKILVDKQNVHVGLNLPVFRCVLRTIPEKTGRGKVQEADRPSLRPSEDA